MIIDRMGSQFVKLAIIMTAVTACSGPSKKMVDLEDALQCDMTIDEVEALANNRVEALESPRRWRTHAVTSADSVLNLGFRQGRLKLSQLTWNELPTRVASYQVVDLCGDAPKEMEATHKLRERK
jgi:hypothetical protein